MAEDKYSAVWISHSSTSDFLKCPRLYYLRAVYKNSASGKKITLMTPHLALGQAVHEVIESLSIIPSEKRFDEPLNKKLAETWEKVSGKRGGFKSREEESEYRERAEQMIRRITNKPGPILKPAIKIRADGGLPYYWLNEKENIILCGKIDWLEYLKESDGVHIIDFKTGKWEESEESMQLPIYYLLASNTQKRKVEKLSYWYIDKSEKPVEMKLPDINDAYEAVMKVAMRIKLARQLEHFKCPQGGCRYCLPMERVAQGKGEKVGESEFGQEIHILP